jgi:dipeptidase E
VTEDRNIVALGGGGFSDDDPWLDDFILELAASARPKICFLPTATGDSDSYIVRFYEAFSGRDCEPSHVKLFAAPDARVVREHLLTRDVIYVGGGNTANMLAVWRLHGVEATLRVAWEHGIVLAGVSAGANCWFEACTTDSFGPIGPLRDGLGFLPGSFCAHYDAEPERRPTFLRLIDEGFPAGYAVENGVGLHFRGVETPEAISSRADGRAYRVERADDEVTEKELAVRRL